MHVHYEVSVAPEVFSNNLSTAPAGDSANSNLVVRSLSALVRVTVHIGQ